MVSGVLLSVSSSLFVLVDETFTFVDTHQLYLNYVRNTDARHHAKGERFDELRNVQTAKRRTDGGQGVDTKRG